jgi:hypothetical protein
MSEYVSPHPTGDAGRLWRRGIELGRGWMMIGDKRVKLRYIGEFDYHKGCKCGCKKAHLIQLFDYMHHGKIQCTKCALQIKWLPKDVFEMLSPDIRRSSL